MVGEILVAPIDFAKRLLQVFPEKGVQKRQGCDIALFSFSLG